jgi:hypothetical protein
MALVSCPECAGQVSDQAVSCPHCGYPIQDQAAKPQDEQAQAPPVVHPPADEAPSPDPVEQATQTSQPTGDQKLGDEDPKYIDSWDPKLNTDSIPAHYTAMGCSGVGLLLILFLLVTLIASGFDKIWLYIGLFILLGWLSLLFFQVLGDLKKLKERRDKSQ